VRALAGLVVALAVALAACGQHATAPPERHRDAAPPRDAAAVVADLPERPLGLPDAAAFDWRHRGGQPAYRLARRAEARGAWDEVASACKDALAADPGHLDAAWLDAIALAKLGRTDDVVAPLQAAVAGDFAKWAGPSLEHPALQVFLATPAGQAWRRRVLADRPRFIAAIAHALVVSAGGALYAVDADGRWLRLTHAGTVIGALAIPAGQRIAYVARRGAHLELGVIDRDSGEIGHPIELGPEPTLAVAYSAKPPTGIWVGAGAAGKLAWRQLGDDGKLHPLPPATPRPAGAWLEAFGHTAHLHRLPVANVTADWDDKSLASAIRIATTNRVIAVPSPGLIDGNTVVWSPDRAHLAFVAQLDDRCTPDAPSAAAFVADAATGHVDELARARRGLAVEWIGDRKLAIAGDDGVSLEQLGGAPVALAGADGLVTPRHHPRCTPEPAEEPTTSDEDNETP